ncbi:MAG: replication associated protein [Avonheates virus SG_4_10]|uniref:replication associated protein n=1 Tax=Avonheates virus SG_4_10 TaxID=2914486 RepID=UPI002481E4A4|nr:MAG: replication associated protein [Avonheates virus SG_4_10]UNI72601.1 MAG: replication associated protein [Avonheates virus SG_4_10]
MSTPPEAIESLLSSLDDISTLSTKVDNDEAPDKRPDDTICDLIESVADNNKNRIGMGLITIFPPSTHPSWLDPKTYFPDADDVLEAWCAKFEVAPATSTIHAHIFFKFTRAKRMRFNALRKLVSDIVGKGCNIRRSRSHSAENQQNVINYVLKTDTTAPDTVPFIWNNSCSFSQTHWEKRTKSTGPTATEQRVTYINSKPIHWTWARIVHESVESQMLLADCSWGKKFHESRAVSIPRRTISNVILMYGAGGTGKTTLAEAWSSSNDEPVECRYYKRNSDDGAFWGGGSTAYKGQRVIHFEEFCGGETLSNMKTWCDVGKYGPSVNIKNGGAELNHDTVIITSNDHPAAWYRSKWAKDPKQFHPFWRRITKIWFFPALRPDGSYNRPDSENPPYYIDQTDDWIGFEGEYPAAVAHAESHWPLPESVDEDGGGAFAPGFHLPGVTDSPARKRQRSH